MLAFGNLGVQGGYLNVQGWLYDTKNPQSPQVLGKQYREQANDANARLIAHRFADEIIFRLGGGIPGIAETKIYFVSNRSGHKEIWQMDYDGANQKQLTHNGSIALSPHVSPDGSRVAYSGVDQRRLADSDVVAGTGPQCELPALRWRPTSRPPGRRMAKRWRSRHRGPATSDIVFRRQQRWHSASPYQDKGPDVSPDLESED